VNKADILRMMMKQMATSKKCKYFEFRSEAIPKNSGKKKGKETATT